MPRIYLPYVKYTMHAQLYQHNQFRLFLFHSMTQISNVSNLGFDRAHSKFSIFRITVVQKYSRIINCDYGYFSEVSRGLRVLEVVLIVVGFFLFLRYIKNILLIASYLLLLWILSGPYCTYVAYTCTRSMQKQKIMPFNFQHEALHFDFSVLYHIVVLFFLLFSLFQKFYLATCSSDGWMVRFNGGTTGKWGDMTYLA